ncbi:hypothetical protein ABK040_016225 [Willaertia magna]
MNAINNGEACSSSSLNFPEALMPITTTEDSNDNHHYLSTTTTATTTPIEAIEYLMNENKLLWKEKLKFETIANSMSEAANQNELNIKKINKYKKALKTEQLEKENLQRQVDDLKQQLALLTSQTLSSQTISTTATTTQQGSSPTSSKTLPVNIINNNNNCSQNNNNSPNKEVMLLKNNNLEQLQCNLAQANIKIQLQEQEKKKIALFASKSKQQLLQLQVEHKNLLIDTRKQLQYFNNSVLKHFTNEILSHCKQATELFEEQYTKLEEEFTKYTKESEDQIRETAGYLLKVGGNVKSWKRRWFIFRKDLTFSYYKTVEEKTPLDTIDVSNDLQMEVSADVTQGKPFAFKIVTQNRTYFLCATNEEEKRKWIDTLRRWFEVNKRYLNK